MKLRRYGWIGSFFLLLVGPWAQAKSTAIVRGFVVGNGYAAPMQGYKIAATSVDTGWGLLMGFDLVEAGDLQMELGALVMPRGYVQVFDDQTTASISQTAFEVPLVFRVFIVPFVSVGVGGFLSYALSSAAGLNATDSGLVASASFKLKVIGPVSVLGDVRYHFGLTNLSAVPNFSTSFYDLQGLVGVAFGF